ncbi:penicillin-binding protein 1C [Larkinella insperata]|uniref:peptidoglycan glycosyltransferase n=1 Tax=Larkinella insperata TaxID=332158 RepID=A0ABW3Q7R3_9BACT|nr:penicillin-binding protein 1C [Larkinella insperata]
MLKKLRHIAKRVWSRRRVKALLTLAVLFLVLNLAFPLKIRPRYSTVITAADGTVLHAFLSDDDKWRLVTELDEITPVLQKTILHKEDNYFYYHPGFNPVAMARAAFRNLTTGRRTSGASTITMQVVRLLEPRQRTYTSKIVELFRALQLELFYSKEEILQLYLNLIPYGGNIEGIKSASMLYFGKPPQLLSLAEVTTLAIIPNRPSSLRLGVNNARIVQERNRWLNRFRKTDLFTPEAIADALSEPLTAHRRAMPSRAPHLARRLKKQYADQPVIPSSLRPNRQAQTEQLVTNYVGRIRALNVHNAAVLVINNQTMAVEAYVGSADFANRYDGGQVDGVRAVRSPGSTLKPLLYALAFDKGLMTPKTVLNDVPTNFSGYEPENYDRQFYGPITVESALANSLNVPAVKTLQQVSTPNFVGCLQKAGFETIKKQSKDLGLSVILGGCGVTLEELTRLFAAFANGGQFADLNFVATHQPDSPKKSHLVSAEAAFLITNTLTQITRPDLPNNFDNSYHLPRIAWKTGTSYGRRDAWSIGYNQRYTVGVWVGNFSGEGVAELSGANIATPLLFSIFNAIDYNSARGPFRMPKNLSMRQVCAETGEVPGEFCEHKIVDYAIMGVSPYRRCQHQKAVWTNAPGTVSYCAHCLPESDGPVQRFYPNLAPELIAFYESRRIPYLKIPPHSPACTRVFAQQGPQIVSPNDGSEYFINPQQPQQLQLSCQADNDVKQVYWYLNDKLYQKAAPTEAVFFRPQPGALKISCADDKGRNTDIRILIRAE